MNSQINPNRQIGVKMNNCPHNYIVVDGASKDNAFKITICKTCLEVKTVIPRNASPDTVWDIKDRRITRMSAIKSAVDLSISAQDYTLDNVKELAEAIEKWIYRKE